MNSKFGRYRRTSKSLAVDDGKNKISNLFRYKVLNKET